MSACERRRLRPSALGLHGLDWGRGALTPSGLALRVSADGFPNGKGSFLASPWARVEDGLLSLSLGIKSI